MRNFVAALLADVSPTDARGTDVSPTAASGEANRASFFRRSSETALTSASAEEHKEQTQRNWKFSAKRAWRWLVASGL